MSEKGNSRPHRLKFRASEQGFTVEEADPYLVAELFSGSPGAVMRYRVTLWLPLRKEQATRPCTGSRGKKRKKNLAFQVLTLLGVTL